MRPVQVTVASAEEASDFKTTSLAVALESAARRLAEY
jgi:hypothetical protein